MGSKNEAHAEVEVDDRGRITVPKGIRESLGILSGDELELEIEDNDIVIHTDHEGLVTSVADKEEWGEESFTDAGQALFGDVESDIDTEAESETER